MSREVGWLVALDLGLPSDYLSFRNDPEVIMNRYPCSCVSR
jgi:hypothetical protein